MERHSRLIRRGIVIVATASALTACAGDDKDEALQLAQEACAVDYPDVAGDPFTDTAARQQARDKLIPRIEEAADKSAQAARLDDTWQPLATAFNRAAELASVTTELGDLRDTQVSGGYSEPADVDRDSQLDARRTKLINGLDEPSVTGECRKT
ncbi:hypothetical protein [Streptomyces sp. IB201691-2A2]|uniref:hypothetical protein n=1 Tax=Streptomyces sp. IB201691-2A2 TaxID=2561920 RepID=UPI00117F28F5|nr:hypothetical protein [Streptomyces sp. IB201691-2A2]TRO58544.1 hypothetical protein E4K73_38480 [Streptomyces sp. IB201691-2A2]